AQGEAVLMADKARAALQALALDESASVASAAERALARLGPADAVEDAAEAARRAEEEARLKAEADALDRRRAQLEAAERAAKERAEQLKGQEFERQRKLYEDRERERKRDEQEQDQKPPPPPPPPPPQKSGIGRIVAISTAAILGLGIVGMAIETENALPDDEPDPGPVLPYEVGPPVSDDVATGDYEFSPQSQPEPQQPQPQPSPKVQPSPALSEAARLAEMLSAAARPMLPQPLGPMAALTDVAAEGSRLIFRVQSAEFVPPQ
ncbi:MAG: hypothetical protein R6V43_06000, partial [Halopseudomonas sp.]